MTRTRPTRAWSTTISTCSASAAASSAWSWRWSAPGAFVGASFSGAERHARRVAKVLAIEAREFGAS